MNRLFRPFRFLGWLKRLPRKVAIPLLLFVAGLLGVAIYQGVVAYNYVESNPNFCRACHTMETAWTRWATSEHKNITCHECHSINVISGAEQLIKFSINQPERVSKHASVSDEACQKCHASGDPRWRQIAATAGHQVHAESQNIACVKCHAVTIHRFAPAKKICLACHEERDVTVTGMGEFHCSACHNFLAQGERLLPSRASCLVCHESLQIKGMVFLAEAPMKWDCRQCHQPHEQALPMVACLDCHQKAASQGLHITTAHQGSLCQTCHQPH